MAEIPPYPQQDLARLVLGYLEEEECSSAYMEFIRTSPHLDAFRTNYSNAVMSSFTSITLKNVFAEYCAFKAYIHNCKIPVLRTRLLRCGSLQDAAQFLITHVDVKKLQGPTDNRACNCATFVVPSQPPKRKECEACKTIDNIDTCECLTRPPIYPNLFATPFKQDPAKVAAITDQPLEKLVETTQLADLPGSITARRQSEGLPSIPPCKGDPRLHHHETELCVEANLGALLEQSESQAKAKTSISTGAQSLDLSVKSNDLMNLSEELEIVNSVGNTSTGNVNTSHSNPGPSTDTSSAPEIKRRTGSVDRSFNEFASGVSSGDTKSASEAMPDSSTPESNTSQMVQSANSHETNLAKIVYSDPLKTKLVTKISRQKLNEHTAHRKYAGDTERSEDSSASGGFEGSGHTEKGKTSSQTSVSSSSAKKIEIISNHIVTAEDAKVLTTTILRPLAGKPPGEKFITLPRPHLSQNASIIQVNGRQAFLEKNQGNRMYTKEEILNMPTLIVIPPTTTETLIKSTINYTSTADNTTASSINPADSGFASLERIGDVKSGTDFTANKPFVPNEQLPKETVSMEKMTTPNKPLLLKKASSTPRRNSSSHRRVLDFDTPLRILSKEDIQEEKHHHESPTLTQSHPKLTITTTIDDTNHGLITPAKRLTHLKRPETVKKTPADWDADLRAGLQPPSPEPIQKKVKPKKNKSQKDTIKVKNSEKAKRITKFSAKAKKKSATKENQSTKEQSEEELPIKPCVKPTINIIKDWREEPKAPAVKDGNIDETAAPDTTPETDIRPMTDNPPSATHNLSDIFMLQTPLKNLLHNLQIDTPRFDPSLLDMPISDIKIGSISTPNYLDTPNFLQSGVKCVPGVRATPSSYSSRPSDYSSGGSYYRPDEHDYAPISDLQPPALPPSTSTHPECSTDTVQTCRTPKNKVQKGDSSTIKSSRPRRQCTLKVSYRETPTAKTGKVIDTPDTSKDSHKSESSSGSRSPSVSSTSTETSHHSDSGKKNKVTKECRKESGKLSQTKEHMLRELEIKRKRTIAGLKKKTPLKRKRKSGSSFPKVKITEKKPMRKPKTVAELRQSIGPRKKPHNAKSKGKNTSECITPVSTISAPARSRRKSSTPRKVDKFVVHSIDDSVSVDMPIQPADVDMTEEELPPLRMSSDDGSQDSRCRGVIKNAEGETDDIREIKEYIEKSSEQCSQPTVQELVQRGFDLETAKSIERDLLGSPLRESHGKSETKEMGKIILDVREEIANSSNIVVTIEQSSTNKSLPSVTDTATVVSPAPNHNTLNTSNEANTTNISQKNSTLKNDTPIILEGDIILVRETFGEHSDNYITCHFDDDNEQVKKVCVGDKIDENFSLRIECEDSNIKVCLDKQLTLYDFPPEDLNDNGGNGVQRAEHSPGSSSSSDSEVDECEIVETQTAVESICNIKPLYTPMKVDHDSTFQKQCLTLFDSTLNSLDTPIKMNSPLTSGEAVTPHEEDAQESWQHAPTMKRKEQSGSPVSESSNKKTKSDHQSLIQDMDIESLLTKLHGDKA